MMSYFLEAPVYGGDIHSGFAFADKNGPRELSEEEEALVARRLSEAVELGHRAVWMNPDTDRYGARINGEPLVISGRPVAYTASREGAVFPRSIAQNVVC